MLDSLTNQKLEIQQEDMHGNEGSSCSSEPLQLLVVNLVEDMPVQHYCGSLMPEDEMSGVLDSANASRGVHPAHFEDILQRGNFVIEIPNQSFHSDVMSTKLLRAEPNQRLDLLFQIMREKEISRVLILAPADGNHGLQAP